MPSCDTRLHTHTPMTGAVSNAVAADEQDISHSVVKTQWQPLLMYKQILTAGQSSTVLQNCIMYHHHFLHQHRCCFSENNEDITYLMIVCIWNQQTCLCPKEKQWPHHNAYLHCITTITCGLSHYNGSGRGLWPFQFFMHIYIMFSCIF